MSYEPFSLCIIVCNLLRLIICDDALYMLASMQATQFLCLNNKRMYGED